MSEKDNRFNIPKPVEKKTEVQQIEQIKQVVEQAQVEGWTLDKLGSKLESFNFDDIADRMVNRLLMKFQDQDKPEVKPEVKPMLNTASATEDKPQKIEVTKPEKKEPEKHHGLFGLSS